VLAVARVPRVSQVIRVGDAGNPIDFTNPGNPGNSGNLGNWGHSREEFVVDPLPFPVDLIRCCAKTLQERLGQRQRHFAFPGKYA